ncbi:MAG: aldolase/citrate lyase family protein [Candidatus Aerophobetes bacterium]|nr:aldolase/citrate lyase family protein [Candidatus Aerophobetes bacterium]
MAMIGEVGRKKTSSDCWVRLEPAKSGGVKINLKSKVDSMYGESITKLAKEMMKFFRIDNALLYVEDGGSLPFVLTARIEAAVKKCFPEKREEFLAEIIPQNLYQVKRDNFRRTRLYVPGDQPRLIINAGLYKPDSVILDLEDSVAPGEKESTRFIVRNALREVDFFGAERMVRINQLPLGLDDLSFVVPHRVHTILIPKCEDADEVKRVDVRIQELRARYKVENEVYLMPIVESALGIINAYRIATASPNIVALTIGLEDFTADIGAERTKGGEESFLARLQIVLAARAAGIQPIDSVFSDVADEEGLRNSVLESKKLGFKGKGCIHPGQIKIIHENFAPTGEEIEKAKRIILALEDAQRRGTGVVALGSKMIDPPVVKRAQRTLRLAILNGQIPENWEEVEETKK